MPRLRRAAATLLACAVLGACDGPGGTTAPEPSGATPTDPPAVVAGKPRFDGRLGVVVQAGLRVVSEDGCVRAPHRVCSVDHGEAYVPVREPGHAILEHAATHLADGHTSWTAVLEFADASRPAVALAAREARAVGGLLLVMTREHEVLVAAPYPALRQVTVRLTDLDKPTAWELVGLFAGG